MPQPAGREVEHGTTVSASAAAVYGLIADVTEWPYVFPPTVHVERLDRGPEHERIRIWATANDEPRTWTSRRGLDPAALRVRFRQEVPAAPVAEMGGSWLVEPVPGGGSRVRLKHHYRAVDDDPAALAWIDRAVDRNSTAELAALKAAAESGGAGAELRFTVEDSVVVHGTAHDVYDFLDDAGRWPDRLPHVASARLREDVPGLQLLTMDTRTADGSVHGTTSVRVGFPPHQMVYKQLRTPALMALHTGQWLLEPVPGGIRASSRHTVILDPAAIGPVLGAGASVPEAKAYVRAALGANSRTTLEHAKRHAESRRG